VSIGLYLLAALITLIVEEEISDSTLWIMISVGIFLTVINVGVAVLLGLSRLSTETQNGQLRVSNDSITYWTTNGYVTIPTWNVFGAGTDKGTLFTNLRIYHLAEIPRGFAFVKHDFKRYQVTGGPAMRSIVVTDDGNEIVRKTIMYHRRKRKKAGLEIAKVPSYQFRSSQKLLKSLIFGRANPAVEFSCDGVTLLYAEKGEEYKIQVEMIESAKVVKVQTQHGVTQWDVNLKTNLASGYEKVKVNALQLQHSEEVEQYCRAVATSFPEKDDGYWD
jgi:hypothetical protein